jgi:nicotinate-nucleotide adenylyltransferase
LTRTAVFGGSFNPIHHGHLLLAADVKEMLGLDRVLFIPAAVPPHKPLADLAAAAHRFAMVELAIAAHPTFTVSDLELRRTGPSYTVDTLEELRRDDDELFLVIGSETFLDLLTWYAPERLPRLARLVVVPRTGSAFDPDGAAAQKVLRQIGAEPFVHVAGGATPAHGTLLVHATSLPISASDLRRRAREGRSLAYRLPAPVVEYIRSHGLYGSVRERGAAPAREGRARPEPREIDQAEAGEPGSGTRA